MLLPPDLRDWIPQDDMVRFVVSAVEGMNLSVFKVNVRGTGSEQYPRRMLLALLIYCYANGVFSSRRIEMATYQNLSVRYLTADTHPDHDTIAKFRRENLPAVHACFVHVLEMARALKILKVGTVSIDGTHLRANASKNKNVTYDRAGALIEQLDSEVRDLLEQAEAADNSTQHDGQRLPEAVGRLQDLKAKMEKVRHDLEKRARQRAEAEQAEYERKVQARNQRHGRRKGKKISPPKDTPEGQEQGMGFRQFLLRGFEKVSGEWELVTLAYNMKRLWNLKLART